MVVVIVVFLALLTICFFAFKIGDVFSPWMITVGVWLAIVLLSMNGTGILYPIGQKFYTCLIIWIPIFTFFSVGTYYALPARSYSFVNDNININEGIFKFLFILSVIFTPYLVYEVFKIVSMFGTEDMLANIRSLAVLQSKSGDNEGVLKYIGTINKALFVISLWNIKKVGKIVFSVILLINLLQAISVMEKGFIFFLVFTSLYVLYEREKVEIRTIAFWSITIVFLFYGFNIIRSNVDAENYGTFAEFFSMYVISPSVAFEKTEELLNGQYGTRSFTFLYSFLNKVFSCDYIVMSKLQDFVLVPIPTNVYTIFQPFYQDFGYNGVAFFASVYGVFLGTIYRMFKNGGAVARCVYAYIVYVLILQYFQEHLIISFSVLLQYIILFYLMIQDKFTLSLGNKLKKKL